MLPFNGGKLTIQALVSVGATVPELEQDPIWFTYIYIYQQALIKNMEKKIKLKIASTQSLFSLKLLEWK